MTMDTLVSAASLSGLVYIIVGLLLYARPPKKINWFYGYRTTRSTSSQKAWDFAQKYSGKLMCWYGVVLIAYGILSNILFPTALWKMYLDMVLIITLVFVILYKTEQKLKTLTK